MDYLIQNLATDADVLARYGLTAEEYRDAMPAAIEAARGSMSASNAGRRQFLLDILEALLKAGLVESVTKPQYGDDTVYRLTVPRFGSVAIIQKGCPDGAHSSIRWSVPDWARETYLWWLCDSMKAEPGEHIAKGIQRMRSRVLDPADRTVDGVIFHNHLCGTPKRRCPKQDRAVQIGGLLVPPPCVYIMPDSSKPNVRDLNWAGTQQRFFPGILLGLFGIDQQALPAYLGHVGFQRKNGEVRTTVSARFGIGRSTTYRR
ncbi:hypothetical protein [Micromonospora carbonacea]|uniref:Uncharacterized protein n=1 Tax=Micromonospora carbonacea TaxID=47853 RepID=A0A7H8XGF7_9ACTN|nr:hypothetical protein [Micromonospora carbonacea]MBB5829553.1 hypothetical protein [Micromonospora carbonacea]QLD23042.1 hypothetical protein HXZ27_01275 [Micromonospora carbonacea]